MTRIDLSSRYRQSEWMDDPALDPHLHHQALVALRRINVISRTASCFYHAIKPMLDQTPPGPKRILDIACGGGDVALGLLRIARHQNDPLELTVADLSSTALDYAAQRARASSFPLHCLTHNALQGQWPHGPYHIVINSLMLHHLEAADVITVLRNMRDTAQTGIVVSDLLRCRQGLLAAHLVAHLLTRSPVVRVDAPRSVRGAFSFDELHDLIREADLPGYELRRVWPARALLTWRRP